MAKDIYEDNGLIITSYCGENKEQKIQFTVFPKDFVYLNRKEIKNIVNCLSRWLIENQS